MHVHHKRFLLIRLRPRSSTSLVLSTYLLLKITIICYTSLSIIIMHHQKPARVHCWMDLLYKIEVWHNFHIWQANWRSQFKRIRCPVSMTADSWYPCGRVGVVVKVFYYVATIRPTGTHLCNYILYYIQYL